MLNFCKFAGRDEKCFHKDSGNGADRMVLDEYHRF